MKNIITILLSVLYSAILLGCSNRNVEVPKDNMADLTEISISKGIEETVVLTEQELTQWTSYDNDQENIAFCDDFEDNIFITDEAYMDVHYRLGEENAQQLRVFAENFESWLPEEGATAGGTMGLAVYDLDKDGKLELMCALVQGTGLYACNTFYQAEVENGLVWELDQIARPEELALEIEMIPSDEGWDNAYMDEQGRILYMSVDCEKAGMQSSSCTEGYYYLENGEVVSEEIRSYVTEYYEDENGIYSYYVPNVDASVEKEAWENTKKDFLEGKRAVDASICWKSLYEEEIREKKVLGWFLLLAESLEGAS